MVAVQFVFKIMLVRVALIFSALFLPTAQADTTIDIFFNNSDNLTALFNSDSSPRLFVESSGGLSDSGSVTIPASSDAKDIWTSKTGYSVTGSGNQYIISAFFKNTGDSGHGGLGLSTASTNEHQGTGRTESGLGVTLAGGSGAFHSYSTAGAGSIENYSINWSDSGDELFVGQWYKFELSITSVGNNLFDATLRIFSANSDGTVGAVFTEHTQQGILNEDLATVSQVYSYVSTNALASSRFDKIDNVSIRLLGGVEIIHDPETDTDGDTIPDITDTDDDNDGTPDDEDAFPWNDSETTDTDGDGYGNNTDTNDDGDGAPDSTDAFPLDATETTDTDGDGVGDNGDRFPLDPTESADTDNDGTGNNADNDDDNDGTLDADDAFPLDAAEDTDTDNDGIGNNADNDDDNDTVADADDAFPLDASESADSDNDTYGDNADQFDNDPTEWFDADNDGQGDNADVDDDNDGTEDLEDAFPLDATESIDSDNDSIGNNADPDDDNDSVADADDAFPLDPSESIDTDLDNIGNNADTDDDGDNVADADDAFPLDATEQIDTDNDGIGNTADDDDDNDNVLDVRDAFPLDDTESVDTDSDGMGNNSDLDDDGDSVADIDDAFPLDENETIDTDNDGQGNNSDNDDDDDGVDDINDAFPLDDTESADTDLDGIGNNADTDDDQDNVPDTDDAFPLDASESVDTDEDGTGNNADTDDDGDTVDDIDDAFPLDATETQDNDSDLLGDNADTDDDNDLVLDDNDAFPFDATENTDTDNDGLGNNADTDDDNDLILDGDDAFPLDATESVDTDNDGTGNNLDTDDDGDGTPDNDDAFPLDDSEFVDTDNDGLGNNADQDDDNDGIADVDDAFPLDATESIDTDADGIGNNLDEDDDNDTVPDSLDAFPLDPTASTDTDNDGIDNIIDADDDGDGIADEDDAFPLDATESVDTDADGIGNNADDDDDNDAVADEDDAFPLDNTESIDTDNDGIGNVADPDDDNDDVADEQDLFPLDAGDFADIDNDGLGDNADTDDDNDGTADSADAFPLNPEESADTDGDGVGDNADAFPTDSTEITDADGDGIGDNGDLDDDNDGYTDAIEIANGSDVLDGESRPENLDIDGDTISDLIERGRNSDGDALGDEFDIDSDNDGIFDLLEASENPKAAALLDANADGQHDNAAENTQERVSPIDTDQDGVPDYRDLDSDNDGITDEAETEPLVRAGVPLPEVAQSDPVTTSWLLELQARTVANENNQYIQDQDNDGLVNYRDLDSDNDGLPDLIEAGGIDENADGRADAFLDNNGDGLDDSYAAAPLSAPDTDDDGNRDFLDLDSDNDGVWDLTSANANIPDVDGNGMVDEFTDSDGDGIANEVDVDFTAGIDADDDGIDDRFDASILNEPDIDNDGIADQYDADINGSGWVVPTPVIPPAPLPTPTPVEPPSTPAPANPVVETPAFTTSVSGGGCSITAGADADLTLLALTVLAIIYLTLLRSGTARTLKSAFLIMLSSILATGPTLADVNTGLYLGMGAGISLLDPQASGATITRSDNEGISLHGLLGYQVSRSFAAELEYADLGQATLAPLGSISYRDMNFSGLYHLGGAPKPVAGQRFSLFGKLGVGKISNTSEISIQRSHNMHWLAGAGVQMALSNKLSLRAEAVNYDKDAKRIGLGLTYSFGKKPAKSVAKTAPLPKSMSNPLPKPEPKPEPITTAKIIPASFPEVVSQPSPVAEMEMNSSGAIDLEEQPESESEKRQPVEIVNLEEVGTSAKPIKQDDNVRRVTVVSQSIAETVDVQQSSSTTTAQNIIAPVPSPETSADFLDRQRPYDLLHSSNSANSSTLPIAPLAMGVKTSSRSLVRLLDLSPVEFAFDSSSISRRDEKRLQPLVDLLKQAPDAKVTVTGHTDSIGTRHYNQALSLRRANAIRRYLLDKGINARAILVKGMGERQPLKTNKTPDGRKSNRRVELQVDD